MTSVILSFLTPVEALSLQALDRRMRDNGVGRVQTRLNLPRPIYLTTRAPAVYYLNHKKELIELEPIGPVDFSNKHWITC